MPKDVIQRIGAVVCNPSTRLGFFILEGKKYAFPVDSPPFNDVLVNNPLLLKKPFYLLVTGETFPIVKENGEIQTTQLQPELRKKEINGTAVSKEDLIKQFGMEEIKAIKEMIAQKDVANKQGDKKLSKKIRKILRSKGVRKPVADSIMVYFGG